jgi:hypothetical protein
MLVALLAAGVTVVLWGLGEPLARRIARHHARLVAQAQQLERLAKVADRTQNGVVITDAQGLLVWANQGFTRITGFSPRRGALVASPRASCSSKAPSRPPARRSNGPFGRPSRCGSKSSIAASMAAASGSTWTSSRCATQPAR